MPPDRSRNRTSVSCAKAPRIRWVGLRAGTDSSRGASRLPASVSPRSARRQHLQNPPAEVGQIVRLAAADEVAVDNYRGVFPHPAGIDEIVLDPQRARDADAAIDSGRDRNPAAVTNGGDKLAGGVEVA